jgi:POT family proton-dependent oligopeptide transporter
LPDRDIDMTTLVPATARRDFGTFLGHPTGLSVLFGTEMWERFNYYGMRAILILYMIKYLFLPGAVENVLGYAALKRGLEAAFGPLGIQPMASQIYGFYTALAYLTPILGGYVADRYLGQRRSVYIGCMLMAAGEFMLMSDGLFFIGLFVMIMGNGAFKANLCSQVGNLYAPGDSRRDRAYSIYYVGINLGAFLAPLIAGTLGEKAGWHYGFGASGVGMLIALAIYFAGHRHLPADHVAHASARQTERAPLSKGEWKVIQALMVLVALNAFTWGAYEQQGNTIPLWADEHTNRGIGIAGLEIPVTWFQSFNPILIFLLTPAVIGFWRRQAGRGRESSTVTKMAIGCALVGISYLILTAAALISGTERASWLWLLAFFVTIVVGELYFSPVGMSLVSRVAPPHLVSVLMGLWYLPQFAGNFLSGYLGSFWTRMDKPAFFLMIAGIALVASVAIATLRRPLRGLLGPDF